MPVKEPPPLRLTAEEPDDNRSNIDKRIIDEIVHEIVNSSLLTVGDTRLTVYQASRILGYDDVHPVLRFIHSKELKAHKIGRNWLIWKSDLVAFINRRSNQHNGQDGTVGGGGIEYTQGDVACDW